MWCDFRRSKKRFVGSQRWQPKRSDASTRWKMRCPISNQESWTLWSNINNLCLTAASTLKWRSSRFSLAKCAWSKVLESRIVLRQWESSKHHSCCICAIANCRRKPKYVKICLIRVNSNYRGASKAANRYFRTKKAMKWRKISPS